MSKQEKTQFHQKGKGKFEALFFKWLEGRAIKIWDNAVSYVVSYVLGILSVIFVQEIASTPFRFQDEFVTAESASGPPPIAALIEPFFYEIRRQANEDGFSIDTPFGSSFTLAYCNAFRPGRTDPVGALYKFRDQFPGCLAVTQSSRPGLERLSIQPGPAMTEPVDFYRPDNSSLGRIGFCGCEEGARTAYLERNTRLFGP